MLSVVFVAHVIYSVCFMRSGMAKLNYFECDPFSMFVMGIESSAHTFGVGIVENGKILSNVKDMYKIRDKGMIPNKVSLHHLKRADSVIKEALEVAGIRPNQLGGIGYTMGPGLGPCLQVGMLSAKAMAHSLGIKIAPVNHAVGHVEIARAYAGLEDPLVLYVSGGNSQILKISQDRFRHYAVLGETFDMGIGNMLDTFAREMKLLPAWGSSVEKAAAGGKYIELPYTVKGMDFSFSGLLTRLVELSSRERKEDLCYSLQETAFAMLCEASERALLLTRSKELCVCGGVAQNTRLRNMLAQVAAEHGARFGFGPNEFNADNGGMIAFVAERMLKAGKGVDLGKCEVRQRYRIDEAEVF